MSSISGDGKSVNKGGRPSLLLVDGLPSDDPWYRVRASDASSITDAISPILNIEEPVEDIF